MELAFAPLEGVTGVLYRQLHRRYYPGIGRYYIPFLSPTGEHRFTGRNLRELTGEDPAQTIPQLLTKNAQDFLWATAHLQELGFREVNLNLGCPSGTVVPKGKGAGFLAHPEELARFFDEIFPKAVLPVSVKTRLGLRATEEFPPLLELFNRYPICELIIHPRTGAEFYRGEVHTDSFAYAAAHSTLPLCYNGNLFCDADLQRIREQFPRVGRVMVGRGLVARPSLFTQPPDRETLRAFTAELSRATRESYGTMPMLAKMKELWSYLLHGFVGGSDWNKPLGKAQRCSEFEALTQEIFDTVPLRDELLPFG